MLKPKKLKVLAMILLTSTLLILTSAVSIPSVKAATTTTLVVYNTLGGASTGAVKANGTAMVQTSAGNSLITGDTYQFTATPASGYKFIGWAYADATGPSGTTSATFTKVISAACSLEAIFVPTTNVTATTSGSGASTLVLFGSAGGTTTPAVPSADLFSGYSVSATIGTPTTITETPGTGYTFLCWIVQCSQNNVYTSSTLNYTPTSSGAAIQALFAPTSSGITVSAITATPTPTINEFSTATTLAMVIALVAVAFGTYTYTKKAKK